MKRTVIIHHHIFKNAGTSFNYGLKAFFGDAYLEYDPPNSQVTTQEMLREFILSHPQAQVVSGHHICMPTPQETSFLAASSVLIRKPLFRIRSIYEFERKQQAETEGAIQAKKLDFKDYVVWRLENSPGVFCNYQTLYCSRTDNRNPKYLATEADLAIAIQNLQSCPIVGTVERYAETLVLAEYELAKWYDGIVLKSAHLNTTSKKPVTDKSLREKLVEELSEAVVSQLEELNQLDEKLYEVADGLLSDWFADRTMAKAEYYQSKGDIWFKERKFIDAHSAYSSATLLKPDWFKPYYSLAAVQEKIGELELAQTCYQKAIELKPDFAWSYFCLGNLLSQQEFLEQAVHCYEQAIRVHPVEKSGSFYLALGDALLKQHKTAEAIQSYQKANELEPTVLDCKHKLGLAYSEQQNWEKAIEFHQQSLEIDSQDCTTYFALGDIYFVKKQFDKAQEHYHQGLELCSDISYDFSQYQEKIKECQSYLDTCNESVDV